MNDIDLDRLAREWQRDTDALEVSRRKARRQYWRNRVLLTLEFLLTAVSAFVAWIFWQQAAMVYTVSALVILGAIAMSTWLSLRERVPLWHWHDWSPEGVLRYRIRLCESTLRFTRWCRLSSVILFVFTAYLWVSAVIEPGSIPASFPALYTVVVLLTIVAVEWWAARQRRLRSRELCELQEWLRSFDGA